VKNHKLNLIDKLPWIRN